MTYVIDSFLQWRFPFSRFTFQYLWKVRMFFHGLILTISVTHAIIQIWSGSNLSENNSADNFYICEAKSSRRDSSFEVLKPDFLVGRNVQFILRNVPVFLVDTCPELFEISRANSSLKWSTPWMSLKHFCFFFFFFSFLSCTRNYQGENLRQVPTC